MNYFIEMIVAGVTASDWLACPPHSGEVAGSIPSCVEPQRCILLMVLLHLVLVS